MTTPSHAHAWRDLLVQEQEALAARVTKLDGTEALMPTLRPPMHPADALGGGVRTLAEALLLFGPARCEPHAARLAALLERASQNMDPRRPGRVPTTYGLLSFVLVAQSTGALLPDAWMEQVQTWLHVLVERQPPCDDNARLNCGLLAAGFGLDASARRLLDAPPTAFVSGQSFGDDLRQSCCYLLDGVTARAPLAAVEPAWRDVIDHFPALREARRVHWVSLHALGRVVLHRFGGVPVGQLAARLNHQVMAT